MQYPRMQEVIAHLSQDPHMARVVAEIPFPTGQPTQDMYIALLDSIVSQQLSLKAAATIWGRFVALFPDGYPDAELLLQLPAEVLRSKGLSYNKAAYMHNVARFHLQHGIHNEQLAPMTDDEIIVYLTQIKGVGKWSVQMLLMFALNRPDVFSPDDQGIMNAMRKLYQLEEQGAAFKKRITAIAEPWAPYRTYACRYLWKWKDQKPAIIE